MKLSVEPLTAAPFKPFGAAMHPDAAQKTESANGGTATKYEKIVKITDNYAECKSKTPSYPNCNVTRSTPQKLGKNGLYSGTVMERHPYTTQSFFPMGVAPEKYCYMVIEAPSKADKDEPDMSKAKAFVANGITGVTQNANQWHSPMCAINQPIQFSVFQYMNGVADEDCEFFHLSEAVEVDLSKYLDSTT